MDGNINSHILSVNAGSSSIKFGIFEVINDNPKWLLEAELKDIGQPSASLVERGVETSDNSSSPVAAPDHAAATIVLTDWLGQQGVGQSITAIGHRLVHGGPKYYEPRIIDQDVMAGLHELTIFDPQHLPIEIELIETLRKMFPNAKQVACFDTAFHHGLPPVARLLPIPRRYEKAGLRRYGFHGLSCEFVLRELKTLGGGDGRLILAHLGNGVSLSAVRDGQSIDTTMGLTPAAGVPMSTRSGDLDPGLPLYLALSEGLDAKGFSEMVNFQSGLLGISETSSDMKRLLELESTDNRAKDAVDLFCYQVKKSVGALAAALGGLDSLVFTGGIGENAPEIRARICAGLQFLGVQIDDARNINGAGLISPDHGQVAVRVVHTDESATIVREVWRLINGGGAGAHIQ